MLSISEAVQGAYAVVRELLRLVRSDLGRIGEPALTAAGVAHGSRSIDPGPLTGPAGRSTADLFGQAEGSMEDERMSGSGAQLVSFRCPELRPTCSLR